MPVVDHPIARQNALRDLKAAIRRPIVWVIVAQLRQQTNPRMSMDTIAQRAASRVWGVPELVLRLPAPKRPVSVSTIYRDLRQMRGQQIQHCHTESTGCLPIEEAQPYTDDHQSG